MTPVWVDKIDVEFSTRYRISTTTIISDMSSPLQRYQQVVIDAPLHITVFTLCQM
jgi:hypothetical protein